MATLYITHNDLDGISSALLVEYFDLERDLLIALDYDFEKKLEIVERIEAYNKIVMIDVTCSKQYYDRLISLGKEVWIFDHHESSKWCKDMPNCYHDQSVCGCKVFLKYLSQTNRIKVCLSNYIEIVNIYDLYLTDSPKWETALHLSYVFYGGRDRDVAGKEIYRKFMETQKRKFSTQNKWSFNISEDYLINKGVVAENDMYDMGVELLQKRKDEKGLLFGVTELPSKVSIVAYRILQDYPELNYLIIINTYRGINGKLSIRARKGGFDCTSLTIFEGHKEASGAEVDPVEAETFLKDRNASIAYSDPKVELMNRICNL